jgi:hypothetical protein
MFYHHHHHHHENQGEKGFDMRDLEQLWIDGRIHYNKLKKLYCHCESQNGRHTGTKERKG